MRKLHVQVWRYSHTVFVSQACLRSEEWDGISVPDFHWWSETLAAYESSVYGCRHVLESLTPQALTEYETSGYGSFIEPEELTTYETATYGPLNLSEVLTDAEALIVVSICD